MKASTTLAVSFGVLMALAAGVVIGAVSARNTVHHLEPPDLGRDIHEGVATDDHIWLLGSNGQVVRFDRVAGDRLVVAAHVVDIMADGPHLWTASVFPDGSTFAVRDLNNPALPTHYGETSGEYLQLIRTAGGIGVLTLDAVFLPSDDGLSRRTLTPPLSGWASATVSRTGSIYAGQNFGEFGGRLTRIDTQNGVSHQIAGIDAADGAVGLCEGDFNPDCDPIVGVLPDPQRPDCIIAASGQTHFGMTHGKAYRVCGDAMTLTYETPNRTSLLERLLLPGDYWRSLTAPIESVAQTPDGWVAVSWGRYFRMRGAEVSEHAMPDFRPWSGLFISQEQDGVLFLVAACCSGPAFDSGAWIIAIPVMRSTE